MKKKSLVLTLTAVMLALAVGIGGTIAYFTATTAAVKNTFTTGNVAITLDEAVVDGNWKALTTGERTAAGQDYELVYPGAVLDKDPTIHVATGSSNAYVAMKIEISNADAWKAAAAKHNITNLEDVFGGYVEANWTKIHNDQDTLTFVYMWEANGGVVAAGADCELFETVTIPASFDNAEMASIEGFTITATGYAVQAQGVDAAAAEAQLLALAGVAAQ